MLSRKEKERDSFTAAKHHTKNHSSPHGKSRLHNQEDKESALKKPFPVGLSHSTSRGRASSVSVAAVGNGKEKGNPLVGHAVRRGDGERKASKDEVKNNRSVRWSTSSLPTGNQDNGKRSFRTSKVLSERITPDLHGETNSRSKLALRNPSGSSVSQTCAGFREKARPKRGSSVFRDVPKTEREKKIDEGLKGLHREKTANLVDLKCLDRLKTENVVDLKVNLNESVPSSLHERFAFLEERVAQIASYLQKTKEMLESNNVEASKHMISHMQLSITGIEKAVTLSSSEIKHSLSLQETEKISVLQKPLESERCQDSSEELRFVQNNDDSHSQNDTPLRVSLSFESHSSTKLSNAQDLEDGFFPQQKFMQLAGGSKNQNNKNRIEGDPSRQNVRGNTEKSESLKTSVETPPTEKENGGDGTEPRSEHDSLDKENMPPENRRTLHVAENLNFDKVPHEERERNSLCQLGQKTSTAGWFVSDGNLVLLAHHDGSCTLHDLPNTETKAEYKVPCNVAADNWKDCWLIRAPDSDGRPMKYVVAASAGNALNAGFCSWDLYSQQVVALRTESSSVGLRTSNTSCRPLLPRNFESENHHWWYRPCGPLLISSATGSKTIKMYDIRDGMLMMEWQTQRSITGTNWSSPLQWRNKGKVAIAEMEAISIWDVNSLDPRPVHSITVPGRKVVSLHIHNADAEPSGGVRHRLSSSETVSNDGVFCTQDAVNVCDFRLPSGIGIKIPTFGQILQSLFVRGDSVFGGVNIGLPSKVPVQSRVNQWSIRKGKLVCSYAFPETSTSLEQSSVTQVWGSSGLVMGINGNGLATFDGYQEDSSSGRLQQSHTVKGTKEVIGPDNMLCPSFDCSGSRILLISRDRPAFWRYWL